MEFELGNNTLMVTCTFYPEWFVGYYVILHRSGFLSILTLESRSPSTPVVFPLVNSGQYTVAVFPLTDSGIVGTTGAYTQQVDVTIPSTSTESPTSPSHAGV